MSDLPDFVTERAALFEPLQGEGFTLTLGALRFDWGSGLHAPARLEIGPEGLEGEMELLPGEVLGQMDADEMWATVERWRARLLATPAAALPREIASLGPFAPASPEELEARYRAWQAERGLDDPRAADWRAALVAEARERFPAVAAHVRAIYGLELPPDVAVLSAAFVRFDELPPPLCSTPRTRAGGILDRMAPDGMALRPRDGLDERLHDRFPADPPELLTIAWGDSDGLHFGLWYDDPARPPLGVAANYARDDAETFFVGASLLDALRHGLERRDDPAGEGAFARRAARAEIEAFAAFEEGLPPARLPASERPQILGGLGVDVPGDVPLARYSPDWVRSMLLENRTMAREWVVAARKALARGEAAPALTLGRGMHWLRDPYWREEAESLLADAYRALGRTALEAIVRVHYANRDLPSVGVLEPPSTEY